MCTRYRDCVCFCVCIWEFICVCARIHLIPAGFPLQSLQSDTTDNGCAAVICFIRLSGCFPLLPPVQHSCLHSSQKKRGSPSVLVFCKAKNILMNVKAVLQEKRCKLKLHNILNHNYPRNSTVLQYYKFKRLLGGNI